VGKPVYSSSSPWGQRFLLLEIRMPISMWEQWQGAMHPLLEQEWLLGGVSLPEGWQQARDVEELVGRLPVHSEAVDAGVLGVAPVGQDP
jgi:hypothetical protein